MTQNLNATCIKIIKTLFIYRGGTAKQIAAFVYSPEDYTLAQEKTIYNQLRYLKKSSLVKGHKLQDTISKGSIYYLSQKGFDLAKEILNIHFGQYGKGFSFTDGDDPNITDTYGDFEYSTHMPPLTFVAHHLLLNKFFIKLRKMRDIGVDTRNGLYSVRYYWDNRLRPDAEIAFNNKRFFVEIDRGTEDHDKLRKKFRNYKNYLDSIKGSQSLVLPNGILFVVEEKKYLYGLERRWNNTLTAFLEEMGDWIYDFNLIMFPVSETQEVVSFEDHRNEIEEKVKLSMSEHLNRIKSRPVFYKDTFSDELLFSLSLFEEKKAYFVFFNGISNYLESRIYARYIQFRIRNLTKAKQLEEVEGYTYKGFRKVILSNNPFIIKNFISKYIETETLNYLCDLHNNILNLPIEIR